VLIQVFVDLPLIVAVVGPVAGAYGASRGMRLRLTPSGAALAKRSSAWESLELVSTRWGDSLRTRRGLTNGTKRLSSFLPLYERDWRTGAIGRDIERWAPHLLASPTPGEQAGDTADT
jgi:hypothetical protein